ncbi:MAG: TIGR01459 family HAD-type hydrolase [Rhodobacterales bacterium]|nr:MAG: TIGR01459 family HAD-type hydrolase [Rhodobacterales bacterium]
MTRIIESLAQIAAPYQAAFVDLWGCVHDGVKAHPEAVAALQAFRASGKVVILVTNSPRPHGDVETQLDSLGVPRDAYDAIASSGDSARAAMFRGVVGEKVWFIGQPHETSFFDPMQIIKDPADITRVPLDEAEGIVCCGPEDPMADPSAYRPQFLLAKQNGLKLLCANPDIVVDRGETREWCAGALAALYTDMGGESLYFGKPHPPIYDLARRRLAALGHDIPDAAILAIGDGIGTDIAGAMGEGLDSLFITGGLARAETMTGGQPDPQKLEPFLAEHQTAATYAIAMLA